MPETLQKLRPDRDLQCYFERPSAIAALSEATPTGFVVSGTWRQQFDWAVIEWNRDNVFEHPALRNLPDGDLSGVVLSYEEERSNCMLMDTTIFATVDWPSLRVWVEGQVGDPYRVRLKRYATPVAGSYTPATAQFTLQGTPTAGDHIGLAWAGEQYNYQLNGGDTLETALISLAGAITFFSSTVDATASGDTITLTYIVADQGANGNRIGVHGFVSGARTEIWTPHGRMFSGGTSPTRWRVDLDFSNLRDEFDDPVPTTNVRKMRWTYSAAFQTGAYVRSEFQVKVTQWSVTGARLGYMVAGPGSRRIEDDSNDFTYTGIWHDGMGNFSGGTIRTTISNGASASCAYNATTGHQLYLGTRLAANGGEVTAVVDAGTPKEFNLLLAGEDVLVRLWIADLGPGTHTVTLTHTGADDTYFYFDFLEVAVPAGTLPDFPSQPKLTAATDWDTDHSIALAPERTLWNINHLGFHGRINHYVGALWFYELVRKNHQYASTTVTFAGAPVFNEKTIIEIDRDPPKGVTKIEHVNLFGETPADVAKAFELLINSGYTAIRAEAAGDVLTIYSRSMGFDGNAITVATSTVGAFTATAASPKLTGGDDGNWYTDLNAVPRLNRAVRDWCRAFFVGAKNVDLDVVSAFSTELQHGDPSLEAGIAQRYPSGAAVALNTPAIQTNFSPISMAYWRDVYKEMVAEMDVAGLHPYMQFGEVQWWYFPYDGSGLPFHDEYTKAQFQTAYGFPIRAVPNGYEDPAAYPEEAEFLSTLIGAYTTHIMNYVRTTYPNCRFEALYPPDVNEGAFNRLINYPSEWNPSTLDCLKTESFTYTYNRDLNLSLESMRFSMYKGFPREQRAHLVGISDKIAPWVREVRMAYAENVESIVLFAIDQFCLIGYPAPLPEASRTARDQG